MTVRTTTLAALIVAAGCTLAAAQGMPHGGMHGDASSKAYMDAHDSMMGAMEKLKPTGNPDKDFLTMMIPHHQGAIAMAEVELKYGKDPKAKAMAEKIIADQKREIAKMEKMLGGL